MKRYYITVFFISTCIFCIAQKNYDSLNNIGIENINNTVTKIYKTSDSLNKINKRISDSTINSLQEQHKQELNNLNIIINQKESILNINAQVIKKFDSLRSDVDFYKSYLGQIASLLMKEHYNFSPSILNVLKNIQDKKTLTDKKFNDTIEKFISISNSLKEVEKYLDSEPFDKEKVKGFKAILERYKNEKDLEKFENLKLDINKYISLLKAYCEASNKIYSAITKSVDIPKVRSEMLAEEIEIYGNNYGYLLKLIDKANSDRKFDIKPETCPVQ